MIASKRLLIALGIVSHAALAQAQPMSQEPQPPADVQMQPGPMSPSLPDRTSQPGMAPSEPGSSGTSDASPGTSSSSSSGTSSDTPSGGADTPAETQAGTVPDPSSGGVNGMQSEAGMELRAASPSTAELKPVVQGDVTYLCGGVGEDEEAFMKQEAKGYDLMLTFAARNGAYLADVNVDIADAKGNSVLQATCDGPIMLVDLPRSGSYRVNADAAGYTLQQTVKVSAAKKTRRSVASASLVWPQQVAEGLPSSETATGASGSEEESEGEGSGASGSSDSGVR